jgi:hypothetical protein
MIQFASTTPSSSLFLKAVHISIILPKSLDNRLHVPSQHPSLNNIGMSLVMLALEIIEGGLVLMFHSMGNDFESSWGLLQLALNLVNVVGGVFLELGVGLVARVQLGDERRRPVLHAFPPSVIALKRAL